MMNAFLSHPAHSQNTNRKWLAHGAFALCAVQFIVLTQLWWKPWLANTSFGEKIFSLDHLNLKSAAPLSIHIQEISRHPSQQEYWSIQIQVDNPSNDWVSYPHLVLSFLDEKHIIRYKNIWSPDEYAQQTRHKAIAPHSQQKLRFWLKLPKDIPSEYNLEYFYPY
jgi:hypothetical protein